MTPAADDLVFINTGGTPYGSHAHGLVTKCIRLYGYVRVIGMRFPPNPGQLMGSLLHVGLAHAYAKKGAAQPGGVPVDGVRVTDPDTVMEPEAAVIRASRELTKECNTIDWDGPSTADIDLTLQALAAYNERWTFEERNERVLGVECELKMEIPDSTGTLRPYTQRVDLAVKDHLGHVWYRDHKRLARAGGALVRYQMERQFLTMRMLGMQRHGDRFMGVAVNLIKPEKKGGISSFKFERVAPKPAHHALFRVWEDTAQWKEYLDWVVSRWGGTPKDVWNWPQVDNGEICHGPFGICPAFDLCARGPHGNDARIHIPAAAMPDL